jgi:hypothetical protein
MGRVCLLVGIVGCVAAAACSSLGANSGFDSASGDAGSGPPNGDIGGGSSGSSGSTPAQQGGPAATGVVLVHAAAFPSFRLCFANLPNLQPQPDSKVMPEANVVGVEVGSVVRIDPIDTPGEVFVIDERVPGVQAGAGTIGKTCGELICNGGASCLRKDRDYSSAGVVNKPLGKATVDVMAITGCGNQFFLPDVGVVSTDCPTTPAWDSQSGNLTVQTLTLSPSTIATAKSIPAQVVHMSFLVDKKAKADGDLDVKFGALTTGPSQSIAHDPTLYQNGANETLSVDQTTDAVYAQQGFRVAITPAGGGAPTFSIDLSLADVQALSSPRDVPSEYYRVASNYALLLLGDPRLSPKLGDGGPDPSYDPRRGVHLLAIPVLDPSQLDAGAEGGTTRDQ